MPLILAIESDHRQASHLVQIVRRRLGAELIVAETFEGALPAIGSRVPDLILVPALLSPEDDASLKFVLRVVAGTSHLQVLTTPLFAATAKPTRGMLPRFLRGKTANAAVGCDPEVFARHIASYLMAAAEKRASAQTAAPVLVPIAQAEPEPEPPMARQESLTPIEPPPAAVEVVPVAAEPRAPADEWGLFDPKEAGLEALLTRLRQGAG